MTQTILVTAPERHRRWSGDAELSILVGAFAPEASPIEVARRQGVSSGLLYTWRKKAIASTCHPIQQLVALLPWHWKLAEQRPQAEAA